MPSDWKAIPTVGPGVYEIQLQSAVEHRVLYVAKFAEAIYVLHAFKKKARQTCRADLELAEHRYSELQTRRGRTKES